jgi:hypothetical protein
MTKAERFQVAQQRAAHAQHASEPGHASAGKRARERGRAKDRIPNQASHNEHGRGARSRYGTYEYEVSATARPSRKSSRKSPGRIKPDGPLRLTTMNRIASPKQRSTRPSGNPNG